MVDDQRKMLEEISADAPSISVRNSKIIKISDGKTIVAV